MNPYDALTQSLRLSTPELSSRDGGCGTPLAVLVSDTAQRSFSTIGRWVMKQKTDRRF
jgi:hypothetical protein